METPEKKHRFSLQDYLSYTDANEFKSEFYDGEIFDMAGGTHLHSQICGNTIRALSIALDDTDCIVYDSNLKVNIEAANSVVIPDSQVICTSPELHQDRSDLVKNPVLVVEVLSESTAAWDRGGKFHKYQQLPSLQEYVLIEQERAQVDVLQKNENGIWEIHSYFGLDAVIPLKSLGIEVSMLSIYKKVVFPEAR